MKKPAKSAKKKPPKPAGKKSAKPAKKAQTKKGVGLFGFMARMLCDALDPICQNPNASMRGRHRGYLVKLVPVVGSDGHIDAWVPDADEVKLINASIASGDLPDASDDCQDAYGAPGLPPAATRPVQTSPAPPAPPPVLPPQQPAFNPQGVPGI